MDTLAALNSRVPYMGNGFTWLNTRDVGMSNHAFLPRLGFTDSQKEPSTPLSPDWYCHSP